MTSNYPDNVSAGDARAPWNEPDPDPVVCDECGAPSDTCEVGDTCEECGVGCYEEYEYPGPSDEEVWGAAEAASLRPAPDARDEHQV